MRQEILHRQRAVALDVLPSGQQVVKSEAGADRETRSRTVAVDRQEDLDRSDELRDMLEEPGPLAQRLAHQLELQMFEVAQPAVDHLRRPRRRLRPALPLLEQRDVVVAPRQLPGDAGTIDPAAHHCHAVGA